MECGIYIVCVKMQVEFEAVCGPKFTKFSDDVGSPLYFPAPFFRLSVSRFVQKIFAIKSRSRRKTVHIQKFVGPNFCKRNGSDFSTAVC